MLKAIVFFQLFMLSKCNVKSAPPPSKVECGYKVCPQTKDGALNIHLVPHSHMDAGWVKTFDEYYYGTRTSVSAANVQQIYHSVMAELLHDKKRKFTFSEAGYFWRWWKEQRAPIRATFRTLVQEGRIEIAGGGWVQNDDATTDYLQIIDQFTWGLRKINDTLGPCGRPKAAWQIDTYGHSREQASLLAQMGFDGVFIGRVDYKMREAMLNEERLEFMWRGSDVLGKMTDIMSHALYNLYNAPEGFCFDFLCSDEPVVDNPESPLFNADKRVAEFINQVEKQAKYHDHDNVIVTMGGDFTYQNAAGWYTNVDKLINYVNNHSNLSDINIFYSTPSCYLKSVYLFGRRDKALYTETGDFLPYGSDPNTYWSGFFTSRPSLKYFIRQAHAFLQVVKQISVLTRTNDFYELHLLRQATSLVQHHDAITGTSQQHVASDFMRMLNDAVEACTKKLTSLLSYLTPGWGNSRRKSNQPFVVCHQLNMSQCRFTETFDSFLLLVYNPQSVKTYHFVRLPAVAINYSIKDPNDDEVESQILPLPASIINLPGRASTAIQELVFEAENIPPMGYNAYYITPIKDIASFREYTKEHQSTTIPDDSPISYISNEFLKVAVDKSTGLLQSIQHVDGMSVRVSQNFFTYRYHQAAQNSGAYSFRPQDKPHPVSEKATYHTIRGILVKEIRQRFSDWISQTIRLYRGEEFVELEWVIGPVPIENDVGKEVISLFKTNISNYGVFYTDSNGRQMMRRSCWTDIESKRKPISNCYYPMTSRVCIRESNHTTELCVLADRAQGASSGGEGELEVMVHRRLLTDDGFGLEESLNEEAHGVGLVIKGKHRIMLGNYKEGPSQSDSLTFNERVAESCRSWKMEPWLFFTSGDKLNRRKWQTVKNKRFSPIRIHGLPRHIHILTLEPWKANSVLLRIENTLEKPIRGYAADSKYAINPEDPIARNSHITVDLNKLFHHYKIEKLKETTLAANQWLNDARQMDWSTRYIYNGGDDGIFADDFAVEEKKEDKKSIDSEEDNKNNNSIRKPANRRNKKTKPNPKPSTLKRIKPVDYDSRKKRSATTNKTSDELHENIDNEIFFNADDEMKVTVHKNVTSTAKPSPKTTMPIVTTTSKMKMKRKPEKYFLKETLTNTNNMHRVLQKLPELKFHDNRKGHERGSSADHDYFQSEENSMIDRPFARKKKHQLKADTDDVTRSIYEMYYKLNSRKHRNANQHRISRPDNPDFDEDESEPNGNSNSNGNSKTKSRKSRKDSKDGKSQSKKNRRKKKKLHFDISIPDAGSDADSNNADEDHHHSDEGIDEDENGGRHISKGSDSDEEQSDQDENTEEQDHHDRDEHDRNERKKKRKRRKDAMHEDDEHEKILGRWKRTVKKPEDSKSKTQEQTTTEQTIVDHIVTLRPTQIRTFVIWFENDKTNQAEQ